MIDWYTYTNSGVSVWICRHSGMNFARKQSAYIVYNIVHVERIRCFRRRLDILRQMKIAYLCLRSSYGKDYVDYLTYTKPMEIIEATDKNS